MIAMKKLVLLLFCTCTMLSSYAQQDAQASMYFFNPLQFNSAYAGSREAITVTAVTRAQWIGWDGAPKTQFLSVHAPVLRKRIMIKLVRVLDLMPWHILLIICNSTKKI